MVLKLIYFSLVTETEKGIFDAILGGNLDLRSAPWPSISAAAKDLIRKMLNYDPTKRITTSEALEHPWMKEGGEAFDKPIHKAVLVGMKRFRAINKIKKLVSQADTARSRGTDHIEFLGANIQRHKLERDKHFLKTFQDIDKDNKGWIRRDEFRQALTEYLMGHEAVIDEAIDAFDIENDGKIDYEEFVCMMRKDYPG